MINDLQYFSKDDNGNSYLLNAKSGYPDENNSKIIYLTNVKALINFDNNNEIIVTSENAVYNNSSNDTEFTENVIITYADNELTTKNMKALISQNLVILSGDIVYKNDFTNLYADQIEYDLIEKTSKISAAPMLEPVALVERYSASNALVIVLSFSATYFFIAIT